MGIKRHRTLLETTTTAAATGDWFRLDSRYEEDPTRPIMGKVTAGDTVTIQVTAVDVRGEADPLDTITADDISTTATYTADFDDVLRGNWTHVRAVKTGTTGTTKIQGFI
jgi:hypothetical protein